MPRGVRKATAPTGEQSAPVDIESLVRRIVQEELAKQEVAPFHWHHDAAHGATQSQMVAQWERDKASGLAPDYTAEGRPR